MSGERSRSISRMSVHRSHLLGIAPVVHVRDAHPGTVTQPQCASANQQRDERYPGQPHSLIFVSIGGCRISRPEVGRSNVWRRSAFVITLTLLIAIAAAASTGLNRMSNAGKSAPIATGIRTTL